MAPPIFISHASVDREDVNALADALREAFSNHLRAFNTSADAFPIQPGERWRDRILAAIKGASLVILWASPEALKSREVAFEIGAALAADRQVIPCCVHISPEELPFSLSETQALTLLDREEGWNSLADRIAEAIHYSSPIDQRPLHSLSQRFKATSNALMVEALGITLELRNTSDTAITNLQVHSLDNIAPLWAKVIEGLDLAPKSAILTMRRDEPSKEVTITWTDIAGCSHKRHFVLPSTMVERP